MPTLRTRQEPAPSGAVGADAIEAAVRRFFAAQSRSSPEPRASLRLAERWKTTLRRLRPLGEVSSGNRIEILADGDEAFERMWSAIAAARVRVSLATYIFHNDRVGRRTLAELVAAARRGVEVLLVYDALGSVEIDDDFSAELCAAGATVLVFNPVWRLGGRWPRFVRNHRKILVVDGTHAFCGGMNVGEEYAGARLGTNLFRDTNLALEGPAAADLEALVLDIISDPVRAPSERAPPRDGGVLVQVLESNVRRQRRAIQKALRLTIERSLERCWLTTPYFLPPARLLRAMRHAARRGVDVRLLTAGQSDVPIVRVASRHLYGRLLRSGVRIFELQRRALHAKVVIVDGIYATVGSFNLDAWSWHRNLEVTVGALDRSVCGQLEGQFEADLEKSTEIDPSRWERRSLYQRAVAWLMYQVLRI